MSVLGLLVGTNGHVEIGVVTVLAVGTTVTRVLEATGTGVAHTADGNKFLSVGDFGAAQKLLDAQPLAPWFGILDGFAREAFPTMGRTLGGGPGYRWTLWQSEWATDLIFDSPGSVAPLMDSLLRIAP